MARYCVLLPYHWGSFAGGAEYQAHLLCSYIQSQPDHEAVYLARRVPEDVSAYPYRVEAIGMPQVWGGFGMAIDYFHLAAALQRIQPDVIIQLVAGAYTGIAARYALKHDVPLVWYVASDKDLEASPNVGVESPIRHLDRLFFRYGVRHAAGILVQTEGQKQMLADEYDRAPLCVAPNFLSGPEGPINKPTDAITVAWVANLKPLKRPDLFVALAEHFVRESRLRFVMAGRSDGTDYSEDVIRRAEAAPNLSYLGGLTVEEVEETLTDAHLLINTSDYEGLPNTFIQGWLRDVPTLTLNVDPDGVMERHDIGCKVGTMDQLEAKVAALLEAPADIQRMGANARAYATEHYSMRNAQHLLDHVHPLINEARP